ncbi:hypothetical protein FHW88_002512 [Mucilaginibacter sp. SG538B]|uniref:hypothetical protein n=1 Tax=Mucilaginibacter sp. SG538B TaxID=2587021 RepID=UPI00159D8CCC|nr:hypothetical protein [Mucilaginibacter sp. SG538B]NVM64184.1 hypothetical protein [Mucilaginibacter sp. SG538B]NVM64223.1 hypothetical protein [Mucilaginibacter sp. SG538B]
MDRVKKIHDLYLKSILDIGENDEESASQLLQNEGINPDRLVNDTLRKINGYEFELMKKAASREQENLFNAVTEKIAWLMQKAPERIITLVNSFVQQRVPAFNFKGTTADSDIAAIFDQIDVVALLERLDAIERELA